MSKKATALVGGFLLALAVAFAGCTFEGDIVHRVVLDDGQGETVHVKQQEEPKRVFVENQQRSERIDLELTVIRVSAEPATIHVRVEDPETGETYAEREIVVGGEMDGDEAGNETGTEATGDSNEQVVLIQYIDVKGKDNFVVVNQALQGEADVEIKATSSPNGAEEQEPYDELTSEG